jgi:hypothetical protein
MYPNQEMLRLLSDKGFVAFLNPLLFSTNLWYQSQDTEYYQKDCNDMIQQAGFNQY